MLVPAWLPDTPSTRADIAAQYTTLSRLDQVSAVQYSAVQYSTVQYSTVQYISVDCAGGGPGAGGAGGTGPAGRHARHLHLGQRATLPPGQGRAQHQHTTVSNIKHYKSTIALQRCYCAAL